MLIMGARKWKRSEKKWRSRKNNWILEQFYDTKLGNKVIALKFFRVLDFASVNFTQAHGKVGRDKTQNKQ